MKHKKVFGIGFHKTATSSLAQALSVLGYNVTGPNGVNNPNIEHDVHHMAKQLTYEFDAFQDNPWPLLYRDLDLWCPDSKFILTLRPTREWIKSVMTHFKTTSTPMREWIYGADSPIDNEEVYIATYEAHNRDVIDYFKDRPEDLLILRITEGEGWGKLCPFLHKDVPNIRFPDVNKAKNREKSGVFEKSI